MSGAVGSGLLAPHSGQNLEVIPVFPQEQFQAPATVVSGFLAPHSGQNLEVILF